MLEIQFLHSLSEEVNSTTFKERIFFFFCDHRDHVRVERVSRRFRRVAFERSWFKITCLEFDRSYDGKVAHNLDLQFFCHFFVKQML